jgi:type IV secretory pathway TraG/TraD family ATPase VirD4
MSEGLSKLISRLFTTGRKYNLRVYVSVTSTSQLQDCFPKGRHHDVLGNAGVVQIFNISDPESSRFLKEVAGEKTAYSRSTSRSSQSGPQGSSSSSSSTTTAVGVPVIRQEEVRGIPKDCQAVILDECPHVLFAETKGYWEIPETAKRAGENPFFDKEKSGKAKPKRRKKVDEVAILLKAYGAK